MAHWIINNPQGLFLDNIIDVYITRARRFEQADIVRFRFLEDNFLKIYYHNMYIKGLLEIYFQIKEQKLDRLLKKPNIYDINSFDELRSIVDDANIKYQNILSKRKNKDAAAGTRVIAENEDFIVYIPDNKGAACELGKGTDWCTAAPGLTYYEKYHKAQDPLIIFISKTDPEDKYQLHFGTKQYMNRYDSPMSGQRLIDFVIMLSESETVDQSIRDMARRMVLIGALNTLTVPPLLRLV